MNSSLMINAISWRVFNRLHETVVVGIADDSRVLVDYSVKSFIIGRLSDRVENHKWQIDGMIKRVCTE